ncbi:encapsulin-associated ferritin-like protein [Anaerosphaera multitolerans]|uniref:Ferritin n=1 Tax=Anaerosphaera multitolerans TaxID=2487351 RepID=A0A437S9M4_9FIRM|nr:ferritin-like domain-containing protein [Anaerosphaera multitolerans]RVU55544.1 ferritin [Anaerosphaera multitolerans]
MAKDYHEPEVELDEKVRDQVRAINSLKEEIEAVDWYMQRVAVASDQELKDIMWHNAVEEMEHAMMTLEWLRRNMDGWDEQMRTYLFTEKPILEVEEEAEAEEDSDDSGTLGIGEL